MAGHSSHTSVMREHSAEGCHGCSQCCQRKADSMLNFLTISIGDIFLIVKTLQIHAHMSPNGCDVKWHVASC